MPATQALKNPYGKSRPLENPYAVYKSRDGSWTWSILKLNQRPDMAVKNQYASAFCKVSSPYTGGHYDLGDTYLNDIGRFHVSGPDILAECGRVTNSTITTEAQAERLASMAGVEIAVD